MNDDYYWITIDLGNSLHDGFNRFGIADVIVSNGEVEKVTRLVYTYRINGYWSTSSLEVSYNDDRALSITYPSGGYKDYDAIERARNFARALNDAISVAERIQDHIEFALDRARARVEAAKELKEQSR